MPNPVVDFVIAGALKAGTSAASDMLSQHDHVYVSEQSEPLFALKPSSTLSALLKAPEEPHVDAPGNARAVGEKCASYFYSPHALSAMRRHNPRMRIIVALRDPVFRAHAHWDMQRQKGLEERSFEEAVVSEIAQRPSKFGDRSVGYLDRGFYVRQLESLWSVFPREQCLIIESSLFKREPTVIWSQMVAFLGLEARPTPEVSAAGSTTRSADFPAPMARETGQRLREFYAVEVDRLERLLGWDLDAWRAVRRPSKNVGDTGVEAGRVHRHVSGDERAA